MTTSRSVRVVRWVEPSGRLRSRPESAAVWSWHVPKSAPWLVGRGGDEPHWVSIVVLWRRPRSPARHVTLRISAGTQHRGRPIAMEEWPAQGCIHVVAIKRCVDGSGVTSTTSCAAERLPSRAVRYVSFANTRAPSFSIIVDQDGHQTDVCSLSVPTHALIVVTPLSSPLGSSHHQRITSPLRSTLSARAPTARNPRIVDPYAGYDAQT